MSAPAWPELEFSTLRQGIVGAGGEAEVDLFQEGRVAVMAETTIGGRLARGLAFTARGTAHALTDEDAIALKRAEVTARLADLARTSAQ